MSVTTPAFGMSTVGGRQPGFRFVRRLATRPGAELSLVRVPHARGERLAVLKRLPPALATDPAAVEKFRFEARIAARLEHPNIVRVFDVVETPSDDYYTMEYVRGADMRQLMDTLAQQQRTLPLDCVLLIALELCNALDYAHHLTDANGVPAPVVHRELSPSKVLLGLDGAIKLTGFGAPPAHGRPRRGRSESVGYTSPERFAGASTDARSDVFALGVLLYELSSGQRLFADATSEHEIMTRILRGDMPRPSEVRRGYPRELEAILMRAVARERTDRYQSAAQLQVDLETFLWSRWPTASTAALAKLLESAVPSEDDVAGKPAWPGPVALARPYPRLPDTKTVVAPPDAQDLLRSKPEKFPESSTMQVALGAPGARRPGDERARTVDELAIPVQYVPDRVPRSHQVTSAQKPSARRSAVGLGTPGAKPSPIGTQPPPLARAEQARGQYQRPTALDEFFEDGVTVARPRKDLGLVMPVEPPTVIDTALPAQMQRAATAAEAAAKPAVATVSETSWTLPPSPPPPDPIDVIKQGLPTPPPAPMRTRRRWPLAISVLTGSALIGVLAAAWAIRSTVHEPSELPDVITAHPSPPTDVVLRTTQREVVALPVAVEVEAKKPKARSAPKRAGDDAVVPATRSLFPPPDRLPTLPGPGSLDALPTIRMIELQGTISDLAVRKAIEQALSPLRGCYRAAARERQMTPRVDLTLAFEVDARRVPANVRVTGGGDLDALAPCARKVVSEIGGLPAPGAGTARVSVSLELRPNP